MMDVELWLKVMLVLAAICALLAAAGLFAAFLLLCKLSALYRGLRARTRIPRDSDGRAFRERL
jgi:hypothetical protein